MSLPEETALRAIKRLIAKTAYAEIEELSNIASVVEKPAGIFVDGWYFPENELQETNPTFGVNDDETAE